MKYRLIASDVDGTLFQSGNQMEEKTVELITRYQRLGGMFTLATGRMKKAIEPFIQTLKIKVPVIVYNGAQVIDPLTDQLIYSRQLTPAFAERAIEMLKTFPLSPVIHVQQQPYVTEFNQRVLAHMEKDGIECLVANDLRVLLAKGPTKILVMGDPAALIEYENTLKQASLPGYQTVFSDKNYLEILPEGASKGDALRLLATRLGLSMEEIVAVGDERNDISMITSAGLGVAVANADEEVKKRADMVTKGSWNRGLEEVIEAILKQEV